VVATVCIEGGGVWSVLEGRVAEELVLFIDGGVWADWLDVTGLLEQRVGARLVS
jgi:hypothetical protein